MALEPIVNQGASYQEGTRTIQKVGARPVIQSINAGHTAVTAATETQAITKMPSSQQEEMTGNQQKNDAEANAQRLKNAVNQANNKIKNTRTRCEFSYNDDVNRVSIKVLDKETNEVIREIPPEEALEMIEKLWEVAGLLVDEKR